MYHLRLMKMTVRRKMYRLLHLLKKIARKRIRRHHHRLVWKAATSHHPLRPLESRVIVKYVRRRHSLMKSP